MQRPRKEPKLTLKELKEAFDNSHDGIMVSDANGSILYANNSYQKMTALKNDICAGKSLYEVVSEGHMKQSAAIMAAEQKKMVTVSHFYPEWGSIFAVSVPIFSPSGKVTKVVTNTRDTAEMLMIKDELENAEKMMQGYSESFNEARFKKGNDVIFISQKMKDVFALADKVSKVDVTVLVLGESGVGKEVVAKYIHENSNRRDMPFIAVNCGAIPEQLLESELFGYATGAFTGAAKGGKSGLFEAAQGGTLFLDEIGDISPGFQVKILRALETRTITRVGDKTATPVDVRILAATHRNLEYMIDIGDFREDLYYRLNVIKIEIPALRERAEDIVPLSLFYLEYFNKRYNFKKRMTLPVLNELKNRKWNGNIRELKNVIERLVVISNTNEFQLSDLPMVEKIMQSKSEKEEGKVIVFDIMPLAEAVESVEIQILERAQKEYGSTREMAKILKVDQSTITRKMKRYGMTSL